MNSPPSEILKNFKNTSRNPSNPQKCKKRRTKHLKSKLNSSSVFEPSSTTALFPSSSSSSSSLSLLDPNTTTTTTTPTSSSVIHAFSPPSMESHPSPHSISLFSHVSTSSSSLPSLFDEEDDDNVDSESVHTGSDSDREIEDELVFLEEEGEDPSSSSLDVNLSSLTFPKPPQAFSLPLNFMLSRTSSNSSHSSTKDQEEEEAPPFTSSSPSHDEAKKHSRPLSVQSSSFLDTNDHPPLQVTSEMNQPTAPSPSPAFRSPPSQSHPLLPSSSSSPFLAEKSDGDGDEERGQVTNPFHCPIPSNATWTRPTSSFMHQLHQFQETHPVTTTTTLTPSSPHLFSSSPTHPLSPLSFSSYAENPPASPTLPYTSLHQGHPHPSTHPFSSSQETTVSSPMSPSLAPPPPSPLVLDAQGRLVPSWEILFSPLYLPYVHPYLPTHPSKYFQGTTKLYTIDYLARKIKYHDVLIEKMRNVHHFPENFKATSSAFVTFTSAHPAAILVQSCSLVFPQHQRLTIDPAPAPTDLIWSSFALFRTKKRTWIRRVSHLLIYLITFSWIFPVTLMVYLVNLDALTKNNPGFQQFILVDHPEWLPYVAYLLPSLIATVLGIVIPYLFLFLLKCQGFFQYSDVERRLTNRYYFFLLFNYLFMISLGYAPLVSLINSVTFLNLPVNGITPSSLDALWKAATQALSKVSNFYLNYIVVQSLLHGCELIQVNWGLFIAWYTTSRWVAKTPRQYRLATGPSPFPYYYYWPSSMLVLTITLVYSLIQPLILVVAGLYFLYGYLVYKHQLMYVYEKRYEQLGQIWTNIVKWVCISLVVFQILMLGVLASKGNYPSSIILAPLPWITLWTFTRWKTVWVNTGLVCLPLDVLSSVKPTTVSSKTTTASDTPSTHTLPRPTPRETMTPPTPTPPPSLSWTPTSFPSSSTTPFTSSSMDVEREHLTCETYYPPCLYQPLPQCLWLPKDPLHAGRFDLNRSYFSSTYCSSTLVVSSESVMHRP
ncbi:hypothetical protein HMI56_002861 [Coelomomyces lativittatus]|nr:hypothetical protein HMI56_002861 [Coelomomyces lativittatus]